MRHRIVFAYFISLCLILASCSSEPSNSSPDPDTTDTGDVTELGDGDTEVSDGDTETDGDTSDDDELEGDETLEHCVVNRSIERDFDLQEGGILNRDNEETEVYDENGILVFEQIMETRDNATSGDRTSTKRDGSLLTQGRIYDDRGWHHTHVVDYEDGLKQSEYFFGFRNNEPEFVRLELDNNISLTGRDRYVANFDYENDGLRRTIDIDENFTGFSDILVEFEVDERGLIQSGALDYSADGSINRQFTFDYNDEGQILSELIEYPSSDSEPERTIYEYDEDGNLTREVVDEGDDEDFESVRLFEYDDQGRLVRERYDDSGNGVYLEEDIYIYDDQGNLIREERRRGYEEVELGRGGTFIVQEFNSRGDITRRVTVDENDEEVGTPTNWEYSYGEDGYTVTESRERAWENPDPEEIDEVTFIETSEYDELGRLVFRETQDDPYQGGDDFTYTTETNVTYDCGVSTDPLEVIAFDAPDVSDEAIPAAFSFRCSNMPCTYECKIDSEPFTACQPGIVYDDVSLGEHTFSVRATDGDGNVSDVATATWTAESGTRE